MKGNALDQLQRFSQHLGLPGRLGAALLAFGAWIGTSALPALREDLTEQQDQAAHLREQLKAATSPLGAASGPAGAGSIESHWRRVWQTLPDASRATPMQASVLAAAKEQGLLVSSVQYQGGPLPGIPSVWRQRIHLPIEGPYASVRAWLGQVLLEPALSIDTLDISRNDAMTDTVKARVVLSLWWRQEAAP